MLSKSWSEKELEILKKYYPKKIPMDEIMEMLPGRSYSSILHKASRLNLKKGDYVPVVRKSRKWTKGEIKIVQSRYGLVEEREILEVVPNRSVTSIKSLVNRVGVKNHRTYRPRGAAWSEYEVEILKQNYKFMTNDELMDLLPHRSFDGIRSRLMILGLRRDKEDLKKARPGRMWTDEENEFLYNNLDKPICELSRLLAARTEFAIRCKIKLIKQQLKDLTNDEN